MGGACAEWRTTKLKKLTAVVLVAVASASMAACGSGSPKALPTVTPTVTAPRPSAPAWEAKFTAAQISDYTAALAAYKRLQVREAPIWANPTGYTSAQAQAIFNADWLTPSVPMYQYQAYLQNHARSIGSATVLSSELLSTTRVDHGLVQIRIQQCVDGSTVKNTVNGQPLAGQRSPKASRTLALVKLPSGVIKLVSSASAKGSGSC